MDEPAWRVSIVAAVLVGCRHHALEQGFEFDPYRLRFEVAERARNRLEGRQARGVAFSSHAPTSERARREGDRLRPRERADALEHPARLSPTSVGNEECQR